MLRTSDGGKLDLLCLHLNWPQVLLCDDIGVVLGLDAGLDHEFEVCHIPLLVEDAYLIVAPDVSCEGVSQRWVVL